MRKLVLAAAFGLAAISHAAVASTVVVEWRGLAGGNDLWHYFGLGDVLVDVPTVLKFSFRTDIPGTYSTDGSTYASVGGFGPQFPPEGTLDASPGHAVITINGISKTIDGLYWSYFNKVRETPWMNLEAYAEDFGSSGTYTYSGSSYLFARFPGAGHSVALDEPMVLSGFCCGLLSGHFQWADYDAATDTGISFDIGFGDGLLTVGPGVPEPASWALMIAGLGMIGMAQRRTVRQRRATQYALASSTKVSGDRECD